MLRKILAVVGLAFIADASEPIPVSYLNCVDAHVVATFHDSVVLRPNAGSKDDSSGKGHAIVTFANPIQLNHRPLSCIPASYLMRQDDSTLVFRTYRAKSLRFRGLPLFSFGAGLTFDGSATLKGELVRLLELSLDSTDVGPLQVQASTFLEASLFRIVGFRYTSGIGGSYYVPQDRGPDLISLPYQVKRYGPFLELNSRMFKSTAPPIGFRYAHNWLSGKLGLVNDTLRSRLLGYAGHETVHIETGGYSNEYSLVVGEELFVSLSWMQQSVQFQSRTILRGGNIAVGFGARI